MKKVAIVGFGESRKQVPYEDEGLEVWGMNELYQLDLPRFDRWFDLHDFDTKHKDAIKNHKSPRFGDQKLVAYKKMTCPVYCQKAWKEIPTSVKYPLKEIQKKWCGGEKGYFTNQVSYMIALALHEGYDEIGLYGIDMLVDEEYSYQRPSVEYWIGVAAGMGKKVTIPTRSTLLKTRFIYGYEKEEVDKWTEMYRSKIKYWAEEKQKCADKIKIQTDLFNQYYGGIEATEILLKEWDNV